MIQTRLLRAAFVAAVSGGSGFSRDAAPIYPTDLDLLDAQYAAVEQHSVSEQPYRPQ